MLGGGEVFPFRNIFLLLVTFWVIDYSTVGRWEGSYCIHMSSWSMGYAEILDILIIFDFLNLQNNLAGSGGLLD